MIFSTFDEKKTELCEHNKSFLEEKDWEKLPYLSYYLF